MTASRVLVVDDDRSILRVVRRALEARGHEVETLEAGRDVPATVARFRPDVVLLDLVLPDSDGIAICGALCEADGPPVIVLSAIGDEQKKVQALDAGAEDYVTKPFGMEELLARIRVAVRRQGAAASGPMLAAGMLRVDLRTREVTAGGVEVHLTPTEFDLLRTLLEGQGRVLTQRALLEHVWGPQYVEDTHILRTFVHQLRQKLSHAAPGSGDCIVTDPGIGYRLVS